MAKAYQQIFIGRVGYNVAEGREWLKPISRFS